MAAIQEAAFTQAVRATFNVPFHWTLFGKKWWQNRVSISWMDFLDCSSWQECGGKVPIYLAFGGRVWIPIRIVFSTTSEFAASIKPESQLSQSGEAKFPFTAPV